MPKPEKTIAAFLQVWENNPELFLAADVEKDLDSLNIAITAPPDAPSEDIAKQIQTWCKKHPNIRDAVRAASRKFDPASNAPTRQQENRTLNNRYPQVSQILLDRLPRNIEALPVRLQQQPLEPLPQSITDLEDERRWDESFSRTQSALVAAARNAKRERAAGKATVMDYEQL